MLIDNKFLNVNIDKVTYNHKIKYLKVFLYRSNVQYTKYNSMI